MKCEECGRFMEADEARELNGKQLCEDCYIDAMTPVKTCDPWATYTASRLEDQELSSRQEAILACIDEKGGATLSELLAATGLSEKDFLREFAALRHMEVAAAAQQADNNKVFVRFEKKD
ncbi:hypothetical protein [Dethiosulfatarculus sandiegensis]|uniref:Uncharacterized protein n=1 Tax=Dethiosulfatarculus sandiegensis TaxID=1429043 RepID=A0A0D2J3A2_9BACT|nr:hypothetical protein [Dethiosulfatarculus sandiegensis]KIX12674.1 hypothetical protein X474_17985 [Dethiosulfatarculus sandiegensis]